MLRGADTDVEFLCVDYAPKSTAFYSSQDNGVWVPMDQRASPGAAYRLCTNQLDHGAYNWVLSADSSDSLCCACALTHTIPDLTISANEDAWLKLETAERRLLFDLLSLQLPSLRSG
jgi:hypothetical protein